MKYFREMENTKKDSIFLILMFVPIGVGSILSIIDQGTFLLFGAFPIFVISSIIWLLTDTTKKGSQSHDGVKRES